MTDQSYFKGFPVECVKFYDELRKNNTKAWFDEHKPDFEKYVMEPARDFVMEMGLALKKISPGIIADTRYSKSIFRPFRDTRFSKDKKPYKTHLGIFFWEGRLAKMDCPGFYFHLEPPMLLIAAGNHCFSKPILDLYRESVVDTKFGKALAKAVKNVKSKGDFQIGEKQYKQVPRGFDKTHENAEFLLLGGLTAWTETTIPDEFYSYEIVNYCLDKFKDLSPIHKWLVEMIGRINK
ncbi:MAG: DUF2461 domain-containing protein [Desulfomonilaceae bacterium]